MKCFCKEPEGKCWGLCEPYNLFQLNSAVTVQKAAIANEHDELCLQKAGSEPDLGCGPYFVDLWP